MTNCAFWLRNLITQQMRVLGQLGAGAVEYPKTITYNNEFREG